MKKTSLIALTFGLLALAAGCGNTSTDSSGTGDDDDDGSSIPLTCEQFSVGAGLTCSNTGAGGKARIDVILGTTTGTATSGTDPRLNAGAAQGLFAGMTTPLAPSTGMRMQSGTLLGVRAADNLCTTAYSGSHACTSEEIYRNAYNGLIATGTNGLIFQSGAYNDQGQLATSDSLRQTCAGLTTANAGSAGTQFDVIAVTVGGTTSPVVKMTAGVSCSTSLPLACCY